MLFTGYELNALGNVRVLGCRKDGVSFPKIAIMSPEIPEISGGLEMLQCKI